LAEILRNPRARHRRGTDALPNLDCSHRSSPSLRAYETTIEIDEVKLDRIMQFTGLATMKEAVDWALTEALRIASIHRVIEDPWSPEGTRQAVDPAYDLIAIRNGSKPIACAPAKPTKRGRPRGSAS
jgi:hypothetical protein